MSWKEWMNPQTDWIAGITGCRFKLGSRLKIYKCQMRGRQELVARH